MHVPNNTRQYSEPVNPPLIAEATSRRFAPKPWAPCHVQRSPAPLTWEEIFERPAAAGVCHRCAALRKAYPP
jgi:hypothetical protein